MFIDKLYEIRRVRQSDVSAVLSVIREARIEYGLERRVETLIEPLDRDLFVTYQQERSDYFVALDGAEVVGGAGIGPLAATDSPTCELQRMYLHSQYRRAGIGLRLLNECIVAAKLFGYRRCYAETVSEMKEAIAFYRAQGFRRLDGPLGETGHGHTDCWMILDFV
jgi:putative acetyltransferase